MMNPESGDQKDSPDKIAGIDPRDEEEVSLGRLLHSLEANKEGLIHLLAEFDARTDIINETIEFAAKNIQSSNEYGEALEGQIADAVNMWAQLVTTYAQMCEHDNNHEEFITAIATLYVSDNQQRDELFSSLCASVRLGGVDHEYTEASIRGAVQGTREQIELKGAAEEAWILYKEAVESDCAQMIGALDARR